MKKTYFGVVLILVVAGLAYFFWSHEAGQQGAGTSKQQPTSAGVKDAPATSSKMDAVPTAVPTGAITPSPARLSLSDIEVDIKATSDLRKVYDKYRNQQDPTNDVAFHLWGLVQECQPIAKMGLEKMLSNIDTSTWPDPDKGAARERAKSIYKRCEGFAQRPVDAAEAQALRDAYVKNTGPASTVIGLASKNRVPANGDMSGDIARVLESGDPAAINLLPALILGNEDWKAHLWADGRSLSPQALKSAWEMAACDLGYNCSNKLDRLCAGEGQCSYSLYEDYIRMAVVSPAEFERAQQLRNKIVQAIQSGNFQAIAIPVPKKGG